MTPGQGVNCVVWNARDRGNLSIPGASVIGVSLVDLDWHVNVFDGDQRSRLEPKVVKGSILLEAVFKRNLRHVFCKLHADFITSIGGTSSNGTDWYIVDVGAHRVQWGWPPPRSTNVVTFLLVPVRSKEGVNTVKVEPGINVAPNELVDARNEGVDVGDGARSEQDCLRDILTCSGCH